MGGRLVYSTCTFNPIEDEAVVAEVSVAGVSQRLVTGNGIRMPPHTGVLQCALLPCQGEGRPCLLLLTHPPTRILQVLRRTKGAFELLDVSDRLPGLRRLPGKQRWRVRDKEHWFDTWEEGKRVSACRRRPPLPAPAAAERVLPVLRLCGVCRGSAALAGGGCCRLVNTMHNTGIHHQQGFKLSTPRVPQ